MSAICIGCRTSQNTEGTKQVDYSGELSGVKNSLDSLLATVQMETTELSNKIGKLKVENKTIYYSVPDSSGKQYPVIISQTNADKEDKENTETTTELHATISELRAEVTSLSQRIDSFVKEQQKVAEMTWWDLHKWEVCVVVVLLIVVGYMIYKLEKKK